MIAKKKSVKVLRWSFPAADILHEAARKWERALPESPARNVRKALLDLIEQVLQVDDVIADAPVEHQYYRAEPAVAALQVASSAVRDNCWGPAPRRKKVIPLRRTP